MSYHECLKSILDLPLSKVFDEASPKLETTVMKVNGELMYIHRVRQEGLIVSGLSGKEKTLLEKDIQTLEVWLPKTGVYTQRGTNNKVVLTRIPERQWRRSFCTSFYGVNYFSEDEFNLLDVGPDVRESFWVDSNRVLRFLDIVVGVHEKDGTMTCTDSRFAQELVDLSREGLHFECQG